MALARWQRTIVDEAGNILPGAQVTVRREVAGAPLAVLYSDRDGATPLGNPFAADADGFAAFHAAGGAHRIDVVGGAFSRTLRYVAIGLQQESDAVLLDVSYLFSDDTGDADPGAGFFRFNHATPASATQLFFDLLDDAGADLTAWLERIDDYGSSTDRGVLIVRSLDGTAEFVGRVTGSVTTATGYRKVAVTPLATTGTFAASLRCGVSFAPRGVDGTGDVDGPAGGVVDNEFAYFNSATGKLIKGSGLLVANDAAVRAATANRVMTTGLIESASAAVALTDAATVAVDWDAGINFTLTVTANRVIGNPTNGQPGTWRTILVQSNDATDRTITFGNQFLGELPTITDVDNTRWYLLTIYCVSASHFVVSGKRANGT
jgi:hypothetical protein